MGEEAIVKDLLIKVEAIARQQEAKKVLAIKIRLGAQAGISSDGLRTQFMRESQGTFSEGARLEILVQEDQQDPRAGEVVLEDVEVAC